MSFFREMKTNLTDGQCIVDALKQLGYKPVVNASAANVRGHYNENRKAEIILKMEDIQDGGDIGFKKGTDGNYTIVGDTYVLHKIKMNKLSEEVTQRYGEVKSMKIARQRGFTFKGRQVQTDGTVKLTFVKA
jgi:hypothetical protein